MLVLSRYVVHEVIKKSNDSLVQIEFSESVPAIDEFANKLIEETHKSFNDSVTLKNTKFKTGQSNVFLTSLTKYLASEDDKNFYEFTVNSLNELKIGLSKQQFATGGYYMFADYKFENKRFISAILLRKKEGINFIKQKNIFKPIEGETLNIEKIAMGFRLNHGIYKLNDDKNYVALVTNQQQKFSEYFKDWVQADDMTSNETNTNSFLRILDGVDIPIDENNKPKYENRDELKKAVFDLIEQGPDKMVNLHMISEHFYGQENRQYLLNYAHNKEFTIDPLFRRSLNILKRLIVIRAKIEGIELHVSVKKLNSKNVDVKEKSIIIHSKELADQIKEQRNAN